MTVAIDAAGTTTVLYSTTAAHYATSASDSPANAQYLPRLKTAGLLRRDITTPGRIYGRTTPGYGFIELANADGALDGWLNYGFDGRQCRILVGEDGAAYASMTVVLIGTMDQIQAPTASTLRLRIRDRLHELDKQVQTTAYGGTNALPAGVDGVDDLQGKLKPRAYGYCANTSPICVNTSRLIYQASDQALYSIPNCWDQGVGLTLGAAYSSQADMETTAPAAGAYRCWLAGGMFRLGSTPSGQVTCNAVQYDITGTSGRAGSLISKIAQDMGIAAGDVSSADVTALNTAAPYGDLGALIPLDGRRTALEIMDFIAGSVGAWYGFDRLGVLRMKQLTSPVFGDDVMMFEAADILGLQRQSSEDSGAGVPAWAIKVRYAPNYTVQSDGELAGSVSLTDRQWKRQEWRNSRSTDATIKNKHLLAGEVEYDSACITLASMTSEANRRLALLKVDRGLYNLRLRLKTSLITTVDLGSIVRVDTTRFSMNAKAFVVVGILHDPLLQVAELTLWG
jgi:hypothetical protein